MIIPEKVKIGYKDYEVVKEPTTIEWGDTKLYGQILYDEEKIRIADNYTDNQKKCTLIHECIHGLDNQYDIGLKEEQVEKLGTALFTMIKDNQEMFKD